MKFDMMSDFIDLMNPITRSFLLLFLSWLLFEGMGYTIILLKRESHVGFYLNIEMLISIKFDMMDLGV